MKLGGRNAKSALKIQGIYSLVSSVFSSIELTKAPGEYFGAGEPRLLPSLPSSIATGLWVASSTMIVPYLCRFLSAKSSTPIIEPQSNYM